MRPDRPTVSIVLPTYNREPLLRDAVASVLDQTFEDWELIVADDGSTDGTRGYLDRLRDSRVRSLLLEHSGSAARTRNAGVAAASGEWVAFLDSDDLWLPDKLRLQLEQLSANPTRGWSCTGVAFIDARGAPIVQPAGVPSHAQSGWILEPLLKFTAAATMSTLMVQRSLFDDVGGFDAAFSVASREDYDLALRLAVRSEIQALPEALTLIRQHDGRTTSAHRVAELHHYNEIAFRRAAASATSRKIRAICRRQCATQLVNQARALSHEGEHWAALVAVARALGDAPFAPDVWRAAGASVLRSLGWMRAPR